jgi:hypothetical protein
MKKRCLVFIVMALLLTIGLATVENTVKTGFARLQYDGGGDWYNDPEVCPMATDAINHAASFPIDQAVVKLLIQNSTIIPFVPYRSGNSAHDREVDNLRPDVRGDFCMPMTIMYG